jgi:glyoxylase-like metal-dependent hydrolase (beta-lactamase superfamily II)
MQVTPSVHAIRHSFRIPAAPGIMLDRTVFSFVIFDETITLIDTGVAGCEAAISGAIRSAGRDPAEIALIILTHSHPDHIGAARAIREATGCSIAAHPAERAWIEDTGLQNRERPVPGFDLLVGGPVVVDHELVEGDVVEHGNNYAADLQVLHTPGHSPGSISLFMAGNGVLFSGDAIPVPGDLPVYDDAVASLRSVRRLSRLTGVRFLCSAWDEPRSGADGYQRMEAGREYLHKIHAAVRSLSPGVSDDLMDLTRKTAAALGLPAQAANPLLARTVAANLRVRECDLPEE